MKTKILKKYDYQTESNKFYTILEGTEFNKEEGVLLNPFINSENLLDREIVVIKDNELGNLINFNIRNTEFGLFLEVYSSNWDDVFIVDKKFDLKEILLLIGKLYSFSFEAAIKYLKYKFGFKDIYFSILRKTVKKILQTMNKYSLYQNIYSTSRVCTL